MSKSIHQSTPNSRPPTPCSTPKDTSPSQITRLAATISECTAIVNDYFLFNDLPMPSFDISGSPHIVVPRHEKKVAFAYAEILRASMELHQLMLGPTAMLMGTSVC